MTVASISSCACGQVRFEVSKDPILTGVCYCRDCQAGARMIEALPDAPAVLDPDGGANYVSVREDYWQCIQGQELLKSLKLKDQSPTTRYVATCCNSAMYLRFAPGCWVSVYRNRLTQDNFPPIEMRTNVRRRTSTLPFPDDAPRYAKFPPKLFWRLIKARIAIAIGR